MRFALAGGLFACALGCTRPPATPAVPATQAAKKHGAFLLALPGSAPAMAVPGAPREIVRGRVRWHLDDTTATRLSEVASDPTLMAIALPPWLGDGLALFGEDSVAIASAAGLRPIARARLTGPSIGAHELWARLQGGGDWVRLDLAKAEASVVAPPISAPIVLPAAYGGRSLTAGPEFGSQSFAVALVDLLGPVMTRDGGSTWSPIEGVRAAFPLALPTRIVRDKGAISLATEERAAPVSQAGVLGASLDLAKGAQAVPDVASLRVEALAPFGVQLGGGELLIADGPRLARIQTDPVRVVRVGRDDSLTRCELGGTQGALALAVCMRHEEGASFGGRLAIGTVVDGASGPRFVSERTFAPSSRWSISPSGAVVVAARCDGSPEGGSDLLTATRVCVRDRAGTWSDLALAGARQMVSPLADGGVVVLRDGGNELVYWPHGATPVTKPARLPIEPGKPRFDVFRVDEVEPGRLTVWRKRASELSALHVRVGDALTLVSESPRTILDERAVVGAFGDRAMIAVNVKGKNELGDQLAGSLTVDGGSTWWTDAFPEGLRTLEPASSSVECGPAGCRAFGWSRVGWEHELAAHDRVVDLDALPRLGPAPAAPKRATVLTASCVRVAPKKTIDADKAYGLVLAKSGASALMGMPAPKPASGQVLVIAPLAFGTVRGGVLSIGPASGAWGANARSVVRFASDLDPPGVVHESAPFASPYGDRIPAGVSASAFALAPGRIVVALWTEGKTEVYRVEAGVVPEKIELAAAVTVGRVVSARELGGTLLLTGGGRKPDGPTTTSGVFAPLFDPTPFVALVDGSGAHAAFLAPGAGVDDAHLGATVDPSRGSFGVATLGSLPTWTGGTLHVLPLAADARPGAGFSSLAGATSDVARPVACTPNAPGWDRVENSWKALSLSIDKEPPIIVQGTASIRTRASSNGLCLERFTFVRGDSIFQLDAGARRAIHLALDDGAATAHRDELSCSFGWE